MSNKTLCITEKLYEYMLSVSLREPEVLLELRRETGLDEQANMQIAPEQGQFMALLVRLLGAKKTLDIGVYTGYSSLCIGLALPQNGRVIACDLNRQWTDIAKRYWHKAGVADKIDLRLAPARQTLEELLANKTAAASFDFAFIDADKVNYDIYYEYCLQLIWPGGLIAVDNVLWDGAVADESVDDVDTEAIRALNSKIHADPRVELSLVPIADGLTLARKM
ncbi:MAG: class I SAM-dependent methyltransferase [Deltaproteobacteria bacterium]|jgi:predicted O-methyltransferase YrrM|nr:class I SAM-dependent methyltransferase [Deltaproteobacteria bacterium]